MAKHTLVAIGWLGAKHVYLDVPLEEAKRRYAEANKDWSGTPYMPEDTPVEMFEVEDEFWAYDVWPGGAPGACEIKLP